MSDMMLTTEAKSDQINFDSFPPGVSRTIKITRVDVKPGIDQPCDVHFEGMNGRVYRPSKGMRRVMVHVWGKDSAAYVGHSMTLYGDPEVMFGAVKAGGIRISHMTGIQKPVTMALTATRANRKPFTVKPLVEEPVVDPALEAAAQEAAGQGVAAYQAFWSGLSKPQRAGLLEHHDNLKSIAKAADDEKARVAAEEKEASTAGDLETPFGKPALDGGVTHVGEAA